MKRIITIIMVRALLLFLLAKPAYASDTAMASASFRPADELVETTSDARVEKLEHYLARHNSPLTEYAATFVKTADKYELPDWRLVPAITGVESTFGKHIPYNSYNAYGWANGDYAFTNWEESIDHVTKTLKEKYYGRGATTVEQIARIYAPPSSTWAGKVHFFMNQIEKEEYLEPHDLALTL